MSEQKKNETPRRRPSPSGEPPKRKKAGEAPRKTVKKPTGEAPRRRTEEAPRRRTEEAPRRRTEDAPRRRTEDAPPRRREEAPRRQTPPNTAQRRTAASRKAPRPRRSPPPRQKKRRSDVAAPEVVYIPPRPFSRNRFLLRLATAVAVVFALTFGLSIFFKVRNITVSGANLYTPWQVREASGIVEGENLLSFGKASAYGRIRAALPYVENVRIGIKLPDTVNIGITEAEVVYSIQTQDGTWWLVSSSGRVVEQVSAANANAHAKIIGVQLAPPVVNGQAVAAEEAVAPVQPGSTDPSAPDVVVPNKATGAQRLSIALEIVKALEQNGFLSDVVSIDVRDAQNLSLWYGTRFDVRLGDWQNIDYKIRCMRQAIDQMGSYQSGTLDISFTVWENMVGYTPFEAG